MARESSPRQKAGIRKTILNALTLIEQNAHASGVHVTGTHK